ncbi:hypothetical protein Tco_0390378 [Tanacetum coccineum]
MAHPTRDQRHQYLRYEGLQYTDADIADFETRLARIYRREIHRGCSRTEFGEVVLDLDTPGALQFQLGRVRRRTAPSYTFIKDPMLRLCHRLITCSIARRSQASEKGLMVIAPALPIIDMAELVRLQLCVELDDTWAWVPTGPARQEGGAGGVAEEAPVAPGGGDKDEEIPQAVPPPPRTQGPVCLTRVIQSRRSSTRDAPGRGLARPALPQPRNSQTPDFLIPYLLILSSVHLYYLIKPGSKFSTIVHEYVTEPSRLSTPKSRMEKRE